MVGAEVAWAPDSKAFFVTYSGGGLIGEYHVLIYYPKDSGLEIREPTAKVREAFLEKPHVCLYPEEPNLAAIAWLGSSEKLLVAAQIMLQSNCDNFGTFDVYEISLPGGRILKEYGQLEAIIQPLFGRRASECP